MDGIDVLSALAFPHPPLSHLSLPSTPSLLPSRSRGLAPRALPAAVRHPQEARPAATPSSGRGPLALARSTRCRRPNPAAILPRSPRGPTSHAQPSAATPPCLAASRLAGEPQPGPLLPTRVTNRGSSMASMAME